MWISLSEQQPAMNNWASVHKVCMTLLKDRELIRSLSDSGYDRWPLPLTAVSLTVSSLKPELFLPQ